MLIFLEYRSSDKLKKSDEYLIVQPVKPQMKLEQITVYF